MPGFKKQPEQAKNTELLRWIESAGVLDWHVLEAFRHVDRALFVPEKYRDRAYGDAPIPIAHHQVTTQPSLIAAMVEALELEGSEKVLEVGTGIGFQAAILSRLSKEVFSIERFWDLAEQAKLNLARSGIRNVHVTVGDGTLGLPSAAPFDAIIVAAAAPTVPEPLIQQLVDHGALVQPIGTGGDEEVCLFRKRDGKLDYEQLITPASFVQLIGHYGL